MAKETLGKYEKSSKDAAADRKGAKSKGESVKKWEGSPADKKADAAAVKKANKR